MQTNQNPETKNQDIDRNRFAKDPIKAGTSREVGEDETALTEGGVSLSPEASAEEEDSASYEDAEDTQDLTDDRAENITEQAALPEEEQTSLNTSGVQEGDTKKNDSSIRGGQERQSA